MRRRSPCSSSEASCQSDIDLTPMLDLSFIMLIFFIVTATFVKEAGIEVDRPAAVSAEQENAKFLVAVTAGNQIWIEQRRVDPRSVQLQLERMHAEYSRGGLVVQADRESSAGAVAVVLDAARAAGIADVAISTQGK
jgi:biopolymer transport protein ExbD